MQYDVNEEKKKEFGHLLFLFFGRFGLQVPSHSKDGREEGGGGVSI